MNKASIHKFRETLPNKNDFWLVFSFSVFVTHVWGYTWFLYHIPALIKRSTLWEITNIAAYNLVSFLCDSLFITIISFVVSRFITTKDYKAHFPITGHIVIFISTIYAALVNLAFPYYPTIIYHFLITKYPNLQISADIFNICLFSTIFFLLVLTIIRLIKYILRNYRITKIINKFTERTTSLSILFLILDMASLILFIFRGFFLTLLGFNTS
jgi:hypothetical protein